MVEYLDVTNPALGTLRYTSLKGKGTLGRIQDLWELYYLLKLRMDRIKREMDKIEKKILKEDPSFFRVRHSLAGSSLPYGFRIRRDRRTRPALAIRNAIILEGDSLKANLICKRLDLDSIEIPTQWQRRFKVKGWQEAYRNKSCRPLVDKMFSLVRAEANLL